MKTADRNPSEEICYSGKWSCNWKGRVTGDLRAGFYVLMSLKRAGITANLCADWEEDDGTGEREQQK